MLKMRSFKVAIYEGSSPRMVVMIKLTRNKIRVLQTLLLTYLSPLIYEDRTVANVPNK